MQSFTYIQAVLARFTKAYNIYSILKKGVLKWCKRVQCKVEIVDSSSLLSADILTQGTYKKYAMCPLVLTVHMSH